MMSTLYWLSRPVKNLSIHQALLSNSAMPVVSRIGNEMESKVCFKSSHYVILYQDMDQLWTFTSHFETRSLILICTLQIPGFSATEWELCLTFLNYHIFWDGTLRRYVELIKNVVGFQTTWCLPIIWITEKIQTLSSSCWTTHDVKERNLCFCWEISQELHTMQILLLQLNPWGM